MIRIDPIQRMNYIVPLIAIAALLMVQRSSAATYDLSPGKPFPPFALPSIHGGEEIDFKEQIGEKLMLHMFASW